GPVILRRFWSAISPDRSCCMKGAPFSAWLARLVLRQGQPCSLPATACSAIPTDSLSCEMNRERSLAFIACWTRRSDASDLPLPVCCSACLERQRILLAADNLRMTLL